MKNATLLLLTLLLNASISYSQCANEANVYIFTYNGKSYEVVKENKTWVNAAACAVERGGYLAEINDASENTAVFNEVSTNAGVNTANTIAPDGGNASYVWLGGSDLVSEGVWIWDGNNDSIGDQFWQGTTTGNPVGGLYNNWGNEPDNWGTGGQDGLGLALTNWPLGVASEWNDVNAGNTLYYVIEYDSSSAVIEKEHSLLITPNPAEDVLQVTGNGIKRITLIDQSGSVIKEMNDLEQESNTIDISALDNGIYLIRIELESGVVIIERISHL